MVMKKVIRVVIALFTLTCLFLIFAGCSPEIDENQTPVAVAIVLGNHANSYALNLSSPGLTAAVEQATSD